MPNTIQFFFDTADTTYIRNAWEKLHTVLPASGVVGITTNPNALDKVKIMTLKAMEARIKELCALVTEIRGDKAGILYAQMPNSRMSTKEIVAFAKYLSQLGDGSTKVGMKIPPFKHVLDLVEELNKYVSVNVTGVSDCAQALRSFGYAVDYVSLIPGRMEEVGINAKAQLSFVADRKTGKSQIIAGSMRTLEQLDWTCKMNTVPTIGTRVWDLALSGDLSKLPKILSRDLSATFKQDYAPHTGQKEIDLAVAFFEQMDQLGASIAKEFLTK